jgi:hypothetical protein
MHVWGLFFFLFFFLIVDIDESRRYHMSSRVSISDPINVMSSYFIMKVNHNWRHVYWRNSDNTRVFVIKLEIREKLIETDG